MTPVTRRLLPVVVLLSGCMAAPPEGNLDEQTSNLSARERRERAGRIRDIAAEYGIREGSWLVAGVGDAETYLTQCEHNLTWACQGPVSSDCGGRPVVAGSGDGPCHRQQGGIGIFQLDAGTYAQTLRREGNRILSIDGNIRAGIEFILDMVERSAYIGGVSTRAEAAAWMNGVTVSNSRFPIWVKTVTHYYNGCRPGYSCYNERFARYRRFARDIRSEFGSTFWSSGTGGGDWIGSACDPSAAGECELGLSGDRCLSAGGAGVCVSSCEGFCPDRAGFATTFCVSLDGGSTGTCLPTAAGGCPTGTEAREMSRHVGSSGAAMSSNTVCVPTGTDPTPRGLCADTCASAGNGTCEDGGADSVFSDCAFGTDCGDCGVRDPGDTPMACLATRESCGAGGTCCGDLSCRDGVTFEDQCCVEAGGACGSGSECCGAMACVAGMCACHSAGRNCVADADCCSGSCSAGRCR